MEEALFVRDLAVVLLVAAVAGFISQRVGLSAVVGYILAGVAIGPFSPAAKVVTDMDHIQWLSQIGLVFLMFSIGLGLSLARLQRMGVSILAAVVISAILLFNICRLFGFALGWDAFQILFLAGTVMISSSAIIIKVLGELNISHQRSGQLALGMTVLEDIVAVVMLTIFVSMIKAGGQETSIWKVLGAVSAFVLLALVAGMLGVPRILKVLSRDPSPELRVTIVAALVLLTAVWALQAGYSLALGAFVLGVVVGGTRYKDELEHAFETLHTVFGAVFFVSVGMLFNFRLLLDVWWLVLVVTLLTMVARPLACAIGLIGGGHSSHHALKAGLALIPIGEFAFVLIQVSKSANVLPEEFYALAIGVSLTTAVVAPLVMRRAEGICNWVEAREPKLLRELIEYHHGWLETLKARTSASTLWRLSSRRVLHAAMHLLFASALIIFSRPVYGVLLERMGQDGLLPTGFRVLYWTCFGALLIGPIIAVWRNLEALAMILAEGAAIESQWLRAMLQTLVKAANMILLFSWFLLLVPRGRWVFWILGIAALVLLLYAPLYWRRLLALHSKFELEVREKVKAASTLGATSGLPVSVLERPQEWDLQIDEVVLPFRTEHAGRPISELAIRKRFGCSIMSIERQGHLIPNPSAGERLYSGDKLLILGTAEQLSHVEEFLRGSGGARETGEFEQIAMETIEVPETCPDLGLDLVGRFNLQVCGIERGGKRLLVPGANERLLPGDKLLLLGTHAQITELRDYFAGFLEVTETGSLTEA